MYKKIKLRFQNLDGAEAIIQEAQTAAEDLWLNLCSQENKITPTRSHSVI